MKNKKRVILFVVLIFVLNAIGHTYGMSVAMTHGKMLTPGPAVAVSLIYIVCGILAFDIRRNLNEKNKGIRLLLWIMGMVWVATSVLTLVFFLVFPFFRN